MSRQVRRWIAMGVFAAILATVFVMLGQWQLRRLDERRANNAVVEAHRDLPVAHYTEVMTGPITDADQWYRVTATGSYEPEQFQVRYRSLDGAYGSEAVAVLRTNEGDLLLVNRGFLVRQPGYPDGVLPAPPPGEVTVTGFVRRNERGDEGAMTPHEDQIRLISSDALGAAMGEDLVDGYVALIESTPAETDVLRTLAEPDLNEGPHLSYALQWFAFTVIGVVGMVVLVRADLRDRRREQSPPGVAPPRPAHPSR
ncbi:SURF1 family cytochrome oxidase biogenesis protein [Tessaracoccus sp. Z1128]